MLPVCEQVTHLGIKGVKEEIMKHLITADDLLKLTQAKADVVIFDCRFALGDPNYARVSYLKEHIAGAYYIDLETDLSGPKTTHGGNHPFRDPSELKQLLQSFGVSDDSIVVIYDHGDFNGPARMLIQLLHIGFKRAYVLAGGIDEWKAAGGPVESGDGPAKPEPGELSILVNNDMIATMQDVKHKLYDPKVMIIDSRSNTRYQGIEEPLYPVAGHIPSAKSYYYGDTLQGAFFKNTDFLHEHFKDLHEVDEIILSCGSGVSACVNSLALRQIGLAHRIYVGSYSDWLSYPENEVKQGEE